MSWNYRVIHVPDETKESGYVYAIHEVYYPENGEPHSRAENPATTVGDSIESPRWILEGGMASSLDKPILEISNDKLRVVEPDSK
jgi:hypothetical protein